MSKPAKSLLIYGNVLINSPLKYEFFKFTLPQWLSYLGAPAIIRVRGSYADDLEVFCRGLENVEFRKGTEYRTWRSQTLADIHSADTPYIFQYLEDHMLHPQAPDFSDLMADLKMLNADVFNYSWFDSYKDFRGFLSAKQAEESGILLGKNLDKALLREVASSSGLYPVGLSSVFSKNFYLTVLKSSRPFVRRFDPSAPFDVEQSARASWLAPLVFALPTSEIGICIDDDHIVPGSSARSRGFFPRGDGPREHTHHREKSFRAIFSAALSWIGSDKVQKLVSKTITFGDVFRYSFEAQLLHFLDSVELKRKFNSPQSKMKIPAD